MAHISDYRGKTRDELKDESRKLKKELFNLRFQVATGELTNNSRFSAVRRDIARIKTVMNEPEGQVVAKKEKKAKPAKAEKAPKETKAKKPATKKKASGE